MVSARDFKRLRIASCTVYSVQALESKKTKKKTIIYWVKTVWSSLQIGILYIYTCIAFHVCDAGKSVYIARLSNDSILSLQ